VYEGPGAGELNLVDDYDHTGGAAELLLITHRTFNATLTSASKYIVLSGEGATNKGVGVMGRFDQKDSNEAHMADGADDGDYVLFCDWNQLPAYLNNLTIPCVRATAMNFIAAV